MNQKEKEISLMANTTTHRKSVSEVQVDIPDDAPMAVLPLNSSSKLDQEPNPFEQSFSGATPTQEEKPKDKLTLPPVASITSTTPLVNNSVIGGGILPKEVSNQFTWDTLRTGPLSPSMLQGPANPEEYYATANMPSKLNNNYPAASSSSISRASFSSTGDVSYPVKIEQSQDVYLHPTAKPPSPPTRQSTRTRQTRKRSSSHQEEDAQSMDSSEYVPHKKTTRRRSSALTNDSEEEEEEEEQEKTTSKKKKSTNKDEDDEKRKNFLERNRIAALKCRQRKKQWLNNLQAKVEFLTNDNERLQMQSESLKEEIVNLKTLLLAHKECPIAQAHGFHPNAIQKASMSSVLSTPIMRQSTSSSMMMQPYLNNRTSTSNSSLPTPQQQQQGSSGNSVTASSSSSSSIPQYQRTSTANIGMPIQSQPAGQQGMVAGGSSGVLRF